MIYKVIFKSEVDAWNFAKDKVANGGLVLDYGVEEHKDTMYYIKYRDNLEEN